MKIVYAVEKSSYNYKDHIGVKKKVESQIQLFRSNGFEASLFQYSWQGGYPIIKIDEDTDVLYFRRIEPSIKFLFYMHKLRRVNSKLRIIMEIPTYPFKGEEKVNVSLKRKISRNFGKIFLGCCVDRVVLIAQKHLISKLYHVPTICVNNGVDFNKISLKKVYTGEKRGIHMICVSGCFFWHGYDRVIEGMHYYYLNNKNPEEIFLYVVGEGDCLEQYKNLADKYNLLNNRIFFFGKKIGEDLDALYDMSDIALDCFGGHRKGLTYASSLKMREYVAKGLPVVTSLEPDIYMEETQKYIKLLDSDESRIPMESIIEFYHDIYDEKNSKAVAEEIRRVFYRHCDWKFTFNPVIEYIKNGI